MKPLWSLADANFRLFRSLKLTLVLMLILGIGAAVGSFFPQLPQNPSLSVEDLRPHYATWLWLGLRFFQVFDLFHSWWFSLGLVLLTLNLLACSAPRIPLLWADLRKPKGDLPPSAQRLELGFELPKTPEARRSLLVQKLGLPKRHLRPDGQGLRFERGRAGRPGFLMVHLGLILLLVSGAWSQLVGRDGSLVLEPGQKSDSLLVTSSDGRMESLRLPFAVGCADFFMEQYGAAGRTVRDYVSQLQIFEGDRLVLQRRVEVNQPLAYGGYHFYQTAYQRVPSLDRVRLAVRDRTGAREVELAEGALVATDERGLRYRLGALREDFKGLGPAAQLEEEFPDGRRRSFWVLERYPGLVERHRAGGLKLDLLELRPGYATVLSAARDPATPGIWLGSLIMMLGLVLVFALRHRALWLREGPEGWELFLWSHRGQAAWAKRLADRLAGVGEGDP